MLRNINSFHLNESSHFRFGLEKACRIRIIHSFSEGEGVSAIDHGLYNSWIEVVDKWRSFDRVVKELLMFCHEEMEGAELGGTHGQER